jgi:hypothetical protein
MFKLVIIYSVLLEITYVVHLLYKFLIPFIFWMQWVSHLNHRGNICGVDFIWLLNPNRYRKLLKTSWSEAVFGMFKVSFFFLLERARILVVFCVGFLMSGAWNKWNFFSYGTWKIEKTILEFLSLTVKFSISVSSTESFPDWRRCLCLTKGW